MLKNTELIEEEKQNLNPDHLILEPNFCSLSGSWEMPHIPTTSLHDDWVIF